MGAGKITVPECYNPDFLWYKGSDIIPLEVSTSKESDITFCFIKKYKFKDFWIEKIKENITKGIHFLFVIGQNGDQLYTLLEPEFLDSIKKKKIMHPFCMGGKACYWFYKTDVKWRILYPKKYCLLNKLLP